MGSARWATVSTPRWVVNAVGGFRAGSVADSDPESLRFLEDLNLAHRVVVLPRGGPATCRRAARSSTSRSRTGVAGGSGAAAYAVTKAAVIRLTEVLAGELAARRVRVNADPPVGDRHPREPRLAVARGAAAKAVAPADLASVIAFLLSDGAAAITGAVDPRLRVGVALELLWEQAGLPAFALPAELAAAYRRDARVRGAAGLRELRRDDRRRHRDPVRSRRRTGWSRAGARPTGS